MGVGVGVDVGVGAGVCVAVGSGVGVSVGVDGADVGVGVDVLITTAEDMSGVGVAVGVLVGIAVGSIVGMTVGPSVGTRVEVGVGVTISSLEMPKNIWPSKTSECPQTNAGSLNVGFGWKRTGRSITTNSPSGAMRITMRDCSNSFHSTGTGKQIAALLINDMLIIGAPSLETNCEVKMSPIAVYPSSWFCNADAGSPGAM